MYRHQLNLLVRYVHGREAYILSSLKRKHDIEGILDQIKCEEAAAEARMEEGVLLRVESRSVKLLSNEHFKSRLGRFFSRK